MNDSADAMSGLSPALWWDEALRSAAPAAPSSLCPGGPPCVPQQAGWTSRDGFPARHRRS
jgi:hypothetical protein